MDRSRMVLPPLSNTLTAKCLTGHFEAEVVPFFSLSYLGHCPCPSGHSEAQSLGGEFRGLCKGSLVRI